MHALSETSTIPIIPGIFHLTLVHNQGIAFGFFRYHPQWLLVLITISLAVLWILTTISYLKKGENRWVLGLIAAGATGNWIDRLRVGAVIDFLDFRIWPVFNLADATITLAVIFYCWKLIKKKA